MVTRASPVSVLVEGITDEVVVRRLLAYVGLPCGIVYGKQGKSYVLRQLMAYNRAAQFAPWLVVVDLDQDAECAPAFVRETLPSPSQGMQLRIAVRAIESWLLADRERIAAYLGIPIVRIPANPDVEPDPKEVLIDLARQSRRRALREDIVPRAESGARVGPGYVGRIIEFLTGSAQPWRPEVAAQHSDSLRRCVEALHQWHATQT